MIRTVKLIDDPVSSNTDTVGSLFSFQFEGTVRSRLVSKGKEASNDPLHNRRRKTI
jgi:hypothetical protein